MLSSLYYPCAVIQDGIRIESNHFTYAMTHLFNKNTYAIIQNECKITYAMVLLLEKSIIFMTED
jgi:hypothetical protein